MASVGPLSAIAATSTGSGSLWQNVTQVYASDDARVVTALVVGPWTSQNLDITAFSSPGIPTDATITGILIEVEKSQDSGAGAINDYIVQLLTGGVPVGDNKADTLSTWPSGANEIPPTPYGGSTDTWGRSWTAAEANAIGLRFAAQNKADTLRRARVDHARVTIYYTESGGGTTFVDGASAPSGVATLSSQGTVVQDASSAPSATAGLTASGTAIADGASTPSGTGNLSASADVLSDGSASLVASPNLTGSGTPIADGSAQLTATPILSASGLVIVPDADVVEGSASLSAIASLTASGVEIPVGSATLTATPELAATGLVVVDGSASPSGVATITASGTLVIFGASTLTALGSIAASGAVYDPDSIVTEFKLRRGLQVGMRAGIP